MQHPSRHQSGGQKHRPAKDPVTLVHWSGHGARSGARGDRVPPPGWQVHREEVRAKKRVICVNARKAASDQVIINAMIGFLFRNTGQLVQGWSADDVQSSENSYESVSCLACTQLHFVNRETGRVLGSEVHK